MINKLPMYLQGVGLVAIGASSWLIAQATALDTAERLVGGVGIAGTAAAIVYFTLRFSVSQRDSWTTLIADERQAKLDAEDERDKYRELYETERERCKELEGH